MARPKGSTSNARERLIEAAGRGFRTGGFGGIGVDGLAKRPVSSPVHFIPTSAPRRKPFASLHDGFEFFQRGIAALRQKVGKNHAAATRLTSWNDGSSLLNRTFQDNGIGYPFSLHSNRTNR
jgi:hypothetical protein